jgi:hypothetical protein
MSTIYSGHLLATIPISSTALSCTLIRMRSTMNPCRESSVGLIFLSLVPLFCLIEHWPHSPLRTCSSWSFRKTQSQFNMLQYRFIVRPQQTCSSRCAESMRFVVLISSCQAATSAHTDHRAPHLSWLTHCMFGKKQLTCSHPSCVLYI